MQSNQATLVGKQSATTVLRFPRRGCDTATIERAARALFEFVFSACDRLDGKHNWNECDEETKEAFRAEAAVVIETVWPLLSRPDGMQANRA